MNNQLRIVEPNFSSDLTSAIIELERLRSPRRLKSRVHPLIFIQIKEIFHTLESLGSVRIEGNNTTLSDIVEKTIDGSLKRDESEETKEFLNTQKALGFIEKNIKEETVIDRKIISEFHKIIVEGLNPSKEGDYTPGKFREIEVSIKNSNHKPPMAVKVPEYMEELVDFINSQKDQKYKLLSIAVAHHRFAWVHPFRNGNGRTVRLITYAMLMSHGFAVNHILNPTAVFCNDRDTYYKMLALADSGTDQGILGWCDYVLKNLLEEIKKIDNLLDYDYLIPKILMPALEDALRRKNINSEEFQILKLSVEKGEIRAADINEVLRKKYHTQVSQYIRKLKEEGLLIDAPGKQRVYTIAFTSNYLLRSVMNQLRQENFIGSL